MYPSVNESVQRQCPGCGLWWKFHILGTDEQNEDWGAISKPLGYELSS